jgi:hypothetical protein
MHILLYMPGSPGCEIRVQAGLSYQSKQWPTSLCCGASGDAAVTGGAGAVTVDDAAVTGDAAVTAGDAAVTAGDGAVTAGAGAASVGAGDGAGAGAGAGAASLLLHHPPYEPVWFLAARTPIAASCSS